MNYKVNKSHDEDGPDWGATALLPVLSQAQTTHQYTVMIDEAIGEASYYRNVVQMLLQATEDDVVILHINSPGGLLSGAQTIIEALKATEAHTVALLVGSCSSAASLISMHCMDVVVTDSAESLIHPPRGGSFGKVTDMHSGSQHFLKVSNRMFKDAYEGFLSEDELKEVIAGREMFLDADDLRQRYQARQDYFMQLSEGDNVEAEEPTEVAGNIEVRSEDRRSKGKKK